MRDKKAYNEYHRRYQLERYHKRRAQVLDHLGGTCAICGVTSELDIDHKDYKEKTIPLNKLWGSSEEKFWAEVDKCQLLCRKHHIAKTSLESKERRPITHGKDWAARKLKCRCELCIQFLTVFNAKRRESRKGV